MILCRSKHKNTISPDEWALWVDTESSFPFELERKEKRVLTQIWWDEEKEAGLKYFIDDWAEL